MEALKKKLERDIASQDLGIHLTTKERKKKSYDNKPK
jgi:hypothetical protein